MTKKPNKGSMNQNSPKLQHYLVESGEEITIGDNSKGNKHNKDQSSKTKEKKLHRKR